MVTTRFVLLIIPLRIGMAILLAGLLNNFFFGEKLYRAIFFTPVVTSAIALSFVMRNIFSEGYGIINYLLSLMGLQGPSWLTNPAWAILTCVLFVVWQGTGQGMVVILAGLQGIPRTLYESASIDGASYLQKFRRITIPCSHSIYFFC